MKVTKFAIEGPLLFEGRKFPDDRGFFSERFRYDTFAAAGFTTQFCQENFSRSLPGVLRGLHYQWEGPQGKLVTALGGRIFDVAVDIRHSSKTFGQHVSVELDGDAPAWFWIPAGFAHGFCVLGPQPADVMYKVDHYYNGANEGGIAYNDASLKIAWPLKEPKLSAKDAVMPSFAEYSKAPRF